MNEETIRVEIRTLMKQSVNEDNEWIACLDRTNEINE